ncbi:MAG: bifunctional riboflavin kinase/FAD synthetase [Candidatus Margulisiibacteriota bacterium]
MKTIRSLAALKNRKIVLALGNFDGVHLGHKKVIGEAVGFAKKNAAACVVMTLDPHPRTVLYKGKDLKLLTTIEERKELIGRLGADALWVIGFTSSTGKLSAESFVSRYFKGARIIKVFAGFDFAFGRGRSSSAGDLIKLGKKRGFSVSIIRHRSFKGVIVKSSFIRGLMSEGKFDRALSFLGHGYQVSGKVIKGRGMGKKLGYPTANLSVDDVKLLPPYGVYAGCCSIKGRTYKAAVNIGNVPTFGQGFVSVEAHLIGFSGVLYGQELTVWLKKKIRGEEYFENARGLKAAIKADIKIASDISLC